MANQERGPLQAKRGSAADWAATTVPLLSGEWGYDETNGIAKIGNGVSLWPDLPLSDVGLTYDPVTGLFSAGGGNLIPSIDPDTGLLTPSVQNALDALNNGKYQTLQNVYVWSYANNLSGAGPGGVTIDATAGANLPRNSTSKTAEGYIAIGRDALGVATWGRGCIAIGSKALGMSNPGFANLAIGMWSLSRVTGADVAASSMPGSRNIGIGALTGHFITSGYRNVYMGRDAGQTLTTGYRNTGVGYRAHASGIAPVGLDGTITNQYPITGSDNSALGDTAGAMLGGDGNVTVGAYALAGARASSGNVIVGANAAQALGANISESGYTIANSGLTGTYSQTGTTITVTTSAAHGATAGRKVSVSFTSGEINAVTGEGQWVTVQSTPSSTTFTITSPVSQIASGNATLNTVETTTTAAPGGLNVVVGYQALADAATSGGNSVFVGEQAARGATGGQNVVVGSRAGFNMTTGTGNTLLGYNAGRALISGGGQTTQSNVSVVGAGAGISGDNQVQLGNSTTTTYVYGTVQNRSDARDKADIRDTVLGLDWVVNHPRPKDFRWDMREDYLERNEDGEIVATHERDGSQKRTRFHHGVIAQEVEAYIEATGIDFGGFQDHERSGGSPVKSIGYDEYVATLIAAVQDLHGIVKRQGEQIAALQDAAGK